MKLDPEVQAMSSVAQALADLEEEAQGRVLEWAWKRFRTSSPVPTSRHVAVDSSPDEGPSSNSPEDDRFEEFYDLFEAAAPGSGPDQVLVGCYWFQELQGQDKFDSQSINTLLKNMGHGSSNITRDMNGLMGRTPSLVMKVKKEGSTKQARNQYKLTRAGLQAVEEMIGRGG